MNRIIKLKLKTKHSSKVYPMEPTNIANVFVDNEFTELNIQLHKKK